MITYTKKNIIMYTKITLSRIKKNITTYTQTKIITYTYNSLLHIPITRTECICEFGEIFPYGPITSIDRFYISERYFLRSKWTSSPLALSGAILAKEECLFTIFFENVSN